MEINFTFMVRSFKNSVMRSIGGWLMIAMIVSLSAPLAVSAQTPAEAGVEPVSTQEVIDTEATSDTSSMVAETTTASEDAPVAPAGAESSEGDSGDAASDGTVGIDAETFVHTENADELDVLPEVTGGVRSTSTGLTSITTGNTYADVEANNKINTTVVRSVRATGTHETNIDHYQIDINGTNTAVVDTAGTTTAISGNNAASSSEGTAVIETGTTQSVINIANIVNTNIINSSGSLNLINKLLTGADSFDLRDFFFADDSGAQASSTACSLVSCIAEDIEYNVQNTNEAQVKNTARLDAVAGHNQAAGIHAEITTGDAFGGANVLTVANSNIIDSNYVLLAANGLGTLNGDIIFPTAQKFWEFFAKPNAVNQVEDAEDAMIHDLNHNQATVANNINTIAETGENHATTSLDALITTGTGFAASNVVNEINKNLFGGDSLYMVIEVHGNWSGDVFGLPDGLTWIATPDGIVITNTENEVAVSEIFAVDVDSYTANFKNHNAVSIENNVDILALTGENSIEGFTGAITTGDAFAGANVINVANTNVIGRNWITATLNIFGDLNGNISFGQSDLWLGGHVQGATAPITPGTVLTYTYTITNNGDMPAHNVILTQDLQGVPVHYLQNESAIFGGARHKSLGTIAPGQTVHAVMELYVNDDIPARELTTIVVSARVAADDADSNRSDNTETLSVEAQGAVVVVPDPVVPPTTTTPAIPTQSTAGSGSSGGGGSGGSGSSGGGGGSSRSDSVSKNSDAALERKTERYDPNSPAKIIISKKADYRDGAIIKAGANVHYQINVRNKGGEAYDAVVTDQLINPIGSIVSEQSWDLGTILPGEIITLDYTTTYSETTPSGVYTNTARIVAYEDTRTNRATSTPPLSITDAVHTVSISGVALAIGNVEPILYVPTSDGRAIALITWETTKPADGQIFYAPQISTSTSPFDVTLPNLGFSYSSPQLSSRKTKHYMVLFNLEKGVPYTYRIKSSDGTHTAYGSDYTVTVPAWLATPRLVIPVLAQN